MQNSTDAQKKRRRDAAQSAAVSSAWLVLSGLVLLGFRWFYRVEGLWGVVLLALAVLDFGMIIPIWILFQQRRKEIEGGEEDAAAQY